MELRKDYVLDRFVFIASNRAKRPRDLARPEAVNDSKRKKENCPLCPGNEDMTPEEIGRLEKDGKWDMRWTPNKFPITEEKGKADLNTEDNFFTFSDSFGKHEIIIETRDHEKQLWDFEIERISNLLRIFNWRTKEMYKIPGVRYVLPFKNHGADAGISLLHSHSQIISMNHIPKEIYEKAVKSNKFGGCEYCKIINIERDSLRSILETENFISFAPYASINNFQVAIFPKQHYRFLGEIEGMFDELSHHISFIAKRLKLLNAPFNIEFIQSPESFNLHFHVEIHPRLSKWGGVELTGSYVNVVPPEDAARFYKGGSLD